MKKTGVITETQKTVSRTTLSLASQGQGRRRVIYRQVQSPKASQREREVQQVSTWEHSGRAILGKAIVSPLNASQLTLWPH